MDPFSRIPPEIRLQIILQLRSRGDVSRLTCASRLMLDQFRESRSYINRFLIHLDFEGDDDLIQDAMAILTFPPITWTVYMGAPSVVTDHVSLWAGHQLPNPFAQNDPDMRDAFEKLYNQLRMFIQDYITKATATFPPRAYLCLRDMSSSRETWTFRSQPVSDIRKFILSDLEDLEMKRLLRAFIRYELIIRLLKGRGRKRLNEAGWKLKKYLSLDFPYWETEAIRSVGEYIETLYAAMFAQCGESWLPTPDQVGNSCLSQGLLFPDNMRVNPELYAKDLASLLRTDGLEVRLDQVTLYSMLSVCGLDLVVNFIALAAAGSTGRCHLKEWFKCFLGSTRYCFWRDQTPFYSQKDLRNTEHIQDPVAPGLGSHLHAHLLSKYPVLPQIYRQRAWAFLDDDRLFPQHSTPRHLPEEDELQPGSEKMDPDWFFNPAAVRAQRRSQKWQDENDHEGSRVQMNAHLKETRDEPGMIITTAQIIPRFFDKPGGYYLPICPQ
ncbi:hypothetical protein NM208_g4485 [Fusarium decemcellulare]|uniref:Uncharacterized protein n=1 Tax=Fusarium decemcellulare TaxID=57161 RepID=A0ACC1SKI4_9HYPO|nr:hypothetical protein NM208_g4485 [Fusarium decemcellulare]